MTDLSVHDFVALQRRLLELELKSEKEEEHSIANSVRSNTAKSSKKGGVGDEGPSHVLRNLEASDVSVGLYGRTVVTLTALTGTTAAADTKKSSEHAADDASPLLPSHRFTVGDEVEIHTRQKSSNGDNAGGVICCVSETSLSIALFSRQKTSQQNNKAESTDDGEDDDVVGSPPLSVIPKSSVEVHRKLIKSLDELEKHGASHPVAGKIVNAVFGTPANDLATPPPPLPAIQPFNPNLDHSQLEAISFALTSEDRCPVALIHGPPGTGKTTTVAELIHQAVLIHRMKVLVTAPSNVAVDNVLEKLVENQSSTKKRSKRKGNSQNRRIRAVRLGHPARIKQSILPYSLESLVQNADGTEIVSDVRQELQSFLRILSNPRSRPADKRAAYREIRSLRKELKTREEKVVQELITSAQVVLATNVGAANRILDRVEDGFDLVVIDESAQALEASCWIPILRGKRLVLAGDHCQLPPTIKSSSQQVQKGLGKTLFERIMELYGESNQKGSGGGRVSRMLRVQYRMHEDIANWASGAMYGGDLETHDDVRSRTLSQLPHVGDVSIDTAEEGYDIGDTTLLLVDTSGCDMHETISPSGSRFNEGEAQIVTQHVRSLLERGLKPEEIAVISPYNGQVELLRTILLPDVPKLEIRSVDGFQGGEREAVILSLVRSSERGGKDGIGFLKDDRRLNVAVTRAKRHCALVCDCETVCQSHFIKGLVSWMEANGDHRSAIEYLSSDTGHVENDMKDVEAELLRLMEDIKDTKIDETKDHSRLPIVISSGSKSESTKEQTPPKEDEDRRKAILDKIAVFAETGSSGEELSLSPELSKFDRRVVHEFAEQLSLGHRSEGVEGVDRRIILSIQKEVQVEVASQENLQKEEDSHIDVEDVISRPALFSALALDVEDSSESEDDEKTEPSISITPTAEVPSMNQLLGELAQERRQRQPEPQREATPQRAAGSGKKKGKKKKNQTKAGTSRPTTKAKSGKEDEVDDDMDDMSFLDAQIEKVQTSHGRKVEGKGSGYRSIVNGILISKPPPREEKKNVRASSALNAKLRKAQEDRRTKQGGKKKK